MMRNILVALTMTVLLVGISCDNSSLVGADIVEEGDGVVVAFTDTTTILAKTIMGEDSLETYSGSPHARHLFIGQMDDPFFGKSNFESYVQPFTNASPADFYDNVNKTYATVDSVVLYMAFDTSRFYGNEMSEHMVQVFQTEAELDTDLDYYAEEGLALNPTPLSDEVRVFQSKNNLELIAQEDTFSLRPGIRVPLDKSFGEALVNDTLIASTDSLLQKFIKGIAIKSNTENSLLTFDFSAALASTNVMNKIVLYYTDSISKAYLFPLAGIKHVWADHDPSGSIVEDAVQNETQPDDLLFVQGFNGHDIELKLPNSRYSNWGDVLIKKAELEFTIAEEIDPASEIYEPINFLVLQKQTDTEERAYIDDVERIIFQNIVDVGDVLGGYLLEEEVNNVVINQYKIDLTSFFQRLIAEGSDYPDVIYITPGISLRNPGRSIIFGQNHATYPLKLNITYSLSN